MICRYIPHSKIKWYLARGWRIRELIGHHSIYSVLAIKDI